MFVVQIMSSTLIICLTAFIATISVKKDMAIFVKYLTEMIAAFAQLLYWCWVGNKVFAQVCTIHSDANSIVINANLIEWITCVLSPLMLHKPCTTLNGIKWIERSSRPHCISYDEHKSQYIFKLERCFKWIFTRSSEYVQYWIDLSMLKWSNFSIGNDFSPYRI